MVQNKDRRKRKDVQEKQERRDNERVTRVERETKA